LILTHEYIQVKDLLKPIYPTRVNVNLTYIPTG